MFWRPALACLALSLPLWSAPQLAAQITPSATENSALQAPPPRELSAQDAQSHSPLIPNFASAPADRPTYLGPPKALSTPPQSREEDAIIPLETIEDVENATSEEDIPAPLDKRLTPEKTAELATNTGELELSEIVLLGLLGRQTDMKALVRTPDGDILTLSAGDQVDGWALQAIGERSIILENGAETTRLFLPNS